MLPKTNRLSRTQFTAFLASQKLYSAYNGLGTIKYSLSENGFSVVTSGKHERRAVVRNKVRRRLYTLLSRLENVSGAVFYLSKQAYSFDWKQTQILFYDLVEKLHTSHR